MAVQALSCIAAVAQAEGPACEPVNPNTTAEARALLKKLCALSGKYTLSGQHNFPNHLSQHSERLAAIVGKSPLIWGSDFGFTDGEDKDSILHRDLMIEEAKRQYAAGSIITLMWHVVRPTDDEPVKPGAGWRGSVQAKLTDEQWQDLITPDTPLHKRWERYIDTVAAYLKQLQDARIPVLWRPYHENNGDWFWWGGRPGEAGFAALYRMTYARMVYVHHLDNLIWVWSPNAPNGKNAGPYADYFPGLRFVDVLACDNYGPMLQSHYDGLVQLANGKPVALGEIGAPFPVDMFTNQPRWVWFMGWSDFFDVEPRDDARRELYRALFADPRVISRGDAIPAN